MSPIVLFGLMIVDGVLFLVYIRWAFDRGDWRNPIDVESTAMENVRKIQKELLRICENKYGRFGMVPVLHRLGLVEKQAGDLVARLREVIVTSIKESTDSFTFSVEVSTITLYEASTGEHLLEIVVQTEEILDRGSRDRLGLPLFNLLDQEPFVALRIQDINIVGGGVIRRPAKRRSDLRVVAS